MRQLLAFSVVLSVGVISASAQTAPKNFETIPKGLFPLTRTPATLTVLVQKSSDIASFTNNSMTEWYQKQTGVTVNWQVVQSMQDTLNLTLSGGKLPDIILNSGISPSLLAIYGKQGLFVPLNDMIAKYGVETKRFLAKYPSAKRILTSPDGKIYSVGAINDCFHCGYSNTMWLYKPWLDTLHLKVPTTTAELEQVLTAFKTKDPNGNGKADEIPLTTYLNDWAAAPYPTFLMNSFTFYPSGGLYADKSGRIVAAYTQAGYRDGLKWMATLSKAGLLDVNGFTQDNDAVKSLNAKVQRVGGLVGAATLDIADYKPNDPKSPFFQYVAVPPLRGPGGVQTTPWSGADGGVQTSKCVVTKDARDPVLAFRWCDALLNQEVTLNSYLGPQGTSWNWAKPGEKGIDGKPALYNALTSSFAAGADARKALVWDQIPPQNLDSTFRLGQAVASPYDLEAWLYKATKLYEPYRQSTLPPLTFNTQDAQAQAQLAASIHKYTTQMEAQFITGRLDIDKGWDGYQAGLKRAGLDQLIALTQRAYDAQKRK